jgi:site-specific DNA-cytosine methylase
MRELSLFAGAGGGILGGQLLGWHTVCAVENDGYAAGVLVGRQNDGCLPPFPVWCDVTTFAGRPWRGIVDVVSGGFPCQGMSQLNFRRKGLQDLRTQLYFELLRVWDIVCTCFGVEEVIDHLKEFDLISCEWVFIERNDGLKIKESGIWEALD